MTLGIDPVTAHTSGRVVATKDEHWFTKRFCEETQKARVDAKFTQAKMAEELGISATRYKNYETRSCLPMVLLPVFCLAVGVSPTAFLARVLRTGGDPKS